MSKSLVFFSFLFFYRKKFSAVMSDCAPAADPIRPSTSSLGSEPPSFTDEDWERITKKVNASLLETKLETPKADVALREKKANSLPRLFCYRSICSQDMLVAHYTGLPSAREFAVLFDLCDGCKIRYYIGWTVEQI